ncbi:MAG: ABC transporter ATP-binding protein [Chloroflexi bacterium]|nr:ABC transporter ATP-binding protein [Chloroflexota bacterium]
MTVRADFAASVGDFRLQVAFESENELVVLYGRSGSGKSVTLRALAGLVRPDAGRIEIGGRAVFDAAAGLELPPQQRRVGYVIQELALFPHLSTRANVLIGLEGDRGAPARYEALRELLSIEGLDERRPHELSGGQQQRVALARALVRPSDVLLLDEPFSALDEALRADLRSELLRLRREIELPIVFVTHDLREAHLLADRVAVIDEGRVLQFDARDEVFRRPSSRRVAELTGIANLFAGEVRGDGVRIAGLTLRAFGLEGTRGRTVDVAIRAERCILRRVDPDGVLPENCFVAVVTRDLAFGNTHSLQLAPEGAGPAVEVEVASRPYEVLGVAEQPRWVVELPAADLHVMARASKEPAPA